jgi:hypothetical protein
MKTQFSGLLRRRDCTADLVETFMQQGIARVQRDLRVPAMERSEIITIGTYSGGIDIPVDYLEVKDVSVNDEDTLDKMDLNKVLRGEKSPGVPVMYARQNGKLRLAPAPDPDTVIRIDYWAELAPLVNDEDTNALTAIAPDMFVYAALTYAADYFVDKRASGFSQTYQTLQSELQGQADRDELAGGAAVAPAYSFPED